MSLEYVLHTMIFHQQDYILETVLSVCSTLVVSESFATIDNVKKESIWLLP
jgi:hypothetical protein